MTLEAVKVTKSFRGRQVLTPSSLVIAPGDVMGLSGPSGRGKTTFARILAGLVAPDTGTVAVDGRSPQPRRAEIAMLFQSPRQSCDPRMTLAQTIRETAKVNDIVGVAQSVAMTSDLLERKPLEVSDGQLQRAALARAIAMSPKYLICDEVTAMLDPATSATIVHRITRLADSGVGVLMISHDTELLDACSTRRVSIERLG